MGVGVAVRRNGNVGVGIYPEDADAFAARAVEAVQVVEGVRVC